MSATTEGSAAGAAGSRIVFISYSHDSDEHRETVLGLAERLRQDGLDAQLDRYVQGTPEQGWPRWMLDRLDEAAFVLVVCTEIYYRRFRGHEVPGRGKGVDWEGALITQEIYDSKSRTLKFVPVLLAAGQESFIPEPLRGQTPYEVTSEQGYQALYRFLLGQAGVKPAPLGEIKPLLQQTAKPLTFDPEPDPSLAAKGLPKTGTTRSSQEGRKASRRRPHPLLWLALPTMVLLPLVGLSTCWHIPTRVQVDLATARLAVKLGGEQHYEVFNRSVPFSSLLFEGCSTAVFAAETLEVADPGQLIPGTEAGEVPRFPATAWRKLPAGLVKLSCQDPASRLALQNPDLAAARLGTLDRIHFAPGSLLILEVSPGQEPALSVEIETSQKLNLPIRRDLELVTQFVAPKGIAVPFPIDLLTWRTRLSERRMFEITSGDRGLVLILTPVGGQAADLFREPLDLPLASVELLAEDLEGTLASPLRDQASLSYPDYPAVPAKTIEKNEAVRLDGLSQARLTSLALDAEKGALRARFDGIVERATSKSGEFSRDHRLTVADTFAYSRRWGLIAVVAVWLVSTTWTAFGVWKKLQE